MHDGKSARPRSSLEVVWTTYNSLSRKSTRMRRTSRRSPLQQWWTTGRSQNPNRKNQSRNPGRLAKGRVLHYQKHNDNARFKWKSCDIPSYWRMPSFPPIPSKPFAPMRKTLCCNTEDRQCKNSFVRCGYLKMFCKYTVIVVLEFVIRLYTSVNEIKCVNIRAFLPCVDSKLYHVNSLLIVVLARAPNCAPVAAAASGTAPAAPTASLSRGDLSKPAARAFCYFRAERPLVRIESGEGVLRFGVLESLLRKARRAKPKPNACVATVRVHRRGIGAVCRRRSWSWGAAEEREAA